MASIDDDDEVVVEEEEEEEEASMAHSRWASPRPKKRTHRLGSPSRPARPVCW